MMTALNDYKQALAKVEKLESEHVDAWQKLLICGIEVDNHELARVLNSSWYYLLSSVRADWPYSLSPGFVNNTL